VVAVAVVAAVVPVVVAVLSSDVCIFCL